MNRLLDDLNDSQREAVTATDGPTLVIAGAGSGKTRVLTRRLAYLLTERLARPYEILAVTFTNKAAGEMKTRVSSLLGGEVPDLNVSTFHSFCARLLRREADHLGYRQDFTIFDADDSRTLVKNCIKELGYSEGQFPARAQLRKISDMKNRLVNVDEFAAQASGYFETRSAAIFSLYQKRLRECQAMDFDDLLFYTVTLLQTNEQIGAKYRERFRYILVDEYQDTNRVQYLLLMALAEQHRNICVVGDEDQSIYGWRGADIRNILDFENDFPGALTIKLEQNYRSTSNILDAASAIIANNEMRKGKKLFTALGDGEPLDLLLVDNADEEARLVVSQITAGQTPLNQVAILYRTNAQSRSFEEQFRRQNLPYQIFGSVSFYARKEIKDLLGYLRLIVNQSDDISFERIVNYPRRGIGQKTLTQIAELAKREAVSRYQIVRDLEKYPELSGKAKRLESFRKIAEKFISEADIRPVDILVQDLVEALSLIPELLNEDPVTGQTRVENIEAFVEGIVEYSRSHPNPRLAEYLQEISLFTDIDQYDETEPKVSLMTIHSAKGLEFDTVYLVGLEEGRFPLQRAIDDPNALEEERRLIYVGLTRARKKVNLSLASIRFQFGDVEAMPSRFVREIPPELLRRNDCRTRTVYQRGEQTAHRVKQPAPTPKPEGTYYEYEGEEMIRPGRIVEHPTFGRGRIMAAEGFGDSLRLEIHFTGLGTKKILARYARLKVVG